MNKLNVGVLGTGNIGTDLLVKLSRLKFINELVFVGRRSNSKGIEFVKNKFDIDVSTDGIDYFKNNKFDVVFDCTNANDAIEHSQIFKELGIYVVDLTPAKIGNFFIPVINPEDISTSNNVNLVTCGGQASIPIITLVASLMKVEYVEVVSQISSKSAGLSTRINIDNYIETTENAIMKFSGVENCKAILNVNPAEPCVDMQTTIFFKTNESLYELSSINDEINNLSKKLNEYIPKYQINVPLSKVKDGIAAVNIKVEGSGDYLPSYAGNLDIINCAAIKALELIYEEYHN
jgi:acetaldehyde dehydrogenase (acetylating)